MPKVKSRFFSYGPETYDPATETRGISAILHNPAVELSKKISILTALLQSNNQIPQDTIILLVRSCLEATKNYASLLRECMISVIRYGKFYLLNTMLEDITAWIVNASSPEEFSFHLNFAINRDKRNFAPKLTTSIINWIKEGITSEETVSNRRISLILQSQSAAQKIIAACLEQEKFNVIDAMASCNNGIPLRSWALFTGDIKQQHERITLILCSNHQSAINTILKHLADWVFNEVQSSLEQRRRLQLVLSSKCESAITEISPYIARWVFSIRSSEQINGKIILVLNSKYQELINAISPYINIVEWVLGAVSSERINRIKATLNSKCQKLINAILPHINIVKWVFDEITPSEQIDRMALILDSGCQELIGTILPHIIKWMLDEIISSKQIIDRMKLILNSGCQKLIEAISPHIVKWVLDEAITPYERMDRMELALSSGCENLAAVAAPYSDTVFAELSHPGTFGNVAFIPFDDDGKQPEETAVMPPQPAAIIPQNLQAPSVSPWTPRDYASPSASPSLEEEYRPPIEGLAQ